MKIKIYNFLVNFYAICSKVFVNDENLQCFLDWSGSSRHSCCGRIASFQGACASSGGRLPEALFMVLLLDSKGAKACKSYRSREELANEYLLLSIYFQNLASIQPRTTPDTDMGYH